MLFPPLFVYLKARLSITVDLLSNSVLSVPLW
jgi:hypothetical protein